MEIWQANAAGRYVHRVDQHPAPLDPNFTGAGRCLTDADGPLPVRHDQAGRVPVGQPPQRLAARRTSTSRCSAGRSRQRLVTQMYFPGDPLFAYDPIFSSVRGRAGARAAGRRASTMRPTEPEWALGYQWDIVLRGRDATPMED